MLRRPAWSRPWAAAAGPGDGEETLTNIDTKKVSLEASPTLLFVIASQLGRAKRRPIGQAPRATQFCEN